MSRGPRGNRGPANWPKFTGTEAKLQLLYRVPLVAMTRLGHPEVMAAHWTAGRNPGLVRLSTQPVYIRSGGDYEYPP